MEEVPEIHRFMEIHIRIVEHLIKCNFQHVFNILVAQKCQIYYFIYHFVFLCLNLVSLNTILVDQWSGVATDIVGVLYLKSTCDKGD